MKRHPSFVFSWGDFATPAPCRPEDQRLIREAREGNPTPSEDSEPRGVYPRKLVAAATGDNRAGRS